MPTKRKTRRTILMDPQLYTEVEKAWVAGKESGVLGSRSYLGSFIETLIKLGLNTFKAPASYDRPRPPKRPPT